jgi:hypothetical protein
MVELFLYSHIIYNKYFGKLYYYVNFKKNTITTLYLKNLYSLFVFQIYLCVIYLNID